MDLPFSIPVLIFGRNKQQAPWVDKLPIGMPTETVVVLYKSSGSYNAGLYAAGANSSWHLVLPYDAVNDFVIEGGAITLYTTFTGTVTPPAGATVYRNGFLVTPGPITPIAGVIWTVVETEATGTAYTLPVASATVLGGVKIGTGLAVAGDGTLSATTGGAGTVTSVGLTMPAPFAVAGTPVTAVGTLAVTIPNQAAKTFYAAPAGATGAPTFRALTTADLPALPAPAIATATAAGIVKGSGNVAIAADGTLSYTLPLATTTVVGGVKQGTNTAIAADGTISVPTGAGYALPAATATVLGGVKQGTNTTIAADGTISVPSNPVPATVVPITDGVAAIGVSPNYARQDHVHPSDVTKANVNNTMFTGQTVVAALNSAGAVNVAGSLSSAQGVLPASTTNSGTIINSIATGAIVDLYNAGNPANARRVTMQFVGSEWSVSPRTDANAVPGKVLAFTVDPTGITGMSSNSGSGSWTHTGSLNVSGSVTTDSFVTTGLSKMSGGFTVATLPPATAALKGYRGYITDSADPGVFGGDLTGGGTVAAPVFCDGTAWIYG